MTRVIHNKWFLRGLLAALVAGAWMYATGPRGVSPILLPPIERVAVNLVSLLTDPVVWREIGVTAFEVAASLAIGMAGAFVLVFWASRSELRTRIVEPILAWSYMTPSVIFFPLFILWFGIGITTKIAFGAYGCFFAIAFTALRGMRTVDTRYVKVAVAFGASPNQLEWMVKFPAALPILLAAARIGAALAFIYVVLAEMLAASRGIGYLITRSSAFFDSGLSYALIIIALVLSGLYFPLIARIGQPRSRRRSRTGDRLRTTSSA